jgi:hypothetical protein
MTYSPMYSRQREDFVQAVTAEVQPLVDQAELAAALAAAWAEGTLPGGAGTKSAKEWATLVASAYRIVDNETRLFVFVDGSGDEIELFGIDLDGRPFWNKPPTDVAGLLVRVGGDVDDGSGDLLQILDQSADGVFLFRIAADGTCYGKFDGVDPAAVAQAIADADEALTTANAALAQASAGAAAQLRRGRAIKFIDDNRFTRPALTSPPSVTIQDAAPGDLPKLWSVTAPGVHSFFGGEVNDSGGAVNVIAVTYPGPQGIRLYWGDTFMCDAPKLAVRFNADATTSWIRIYVDDQLALDYTDIATTNTTRHVIVDFGSRKARKIRIDTLGNGRISGLLTANVDTAWAVPETELLKMAWVADSFGEGLSDRVGVPYSPGQTWPTVTGAFLGIDNVRQCAIGGTGYLNPNSGGGRWKFRDHITDWTGWDPDMVVFAGSVNDTGYTVADVGAEALLTWQQTRTALPDVPIIIVGLMAHPTVFNAVNVENELASRFASWNDPNSLFVRVCTDPKGAWLTGTGSTTSPAGNGNADIYRTGSTHLNQHGDLWAGQRTAQAIHDWLVTR